MDNVNVHEFTISRILDNNGVHGRVARIKPLLPIKNIAAHLQSAKDHKGKPEGCFKNFVDG